MSFKLLVLFFISIYSVSISTETVFARSNKKKKSNRKSTSKKNKRKNRSQSSAKSSTKIENTNTVADNNQKQENKPVNTTASTQNSPTQQNTTVANNEQTKTEAKTNTTQDEIKSNPDNKSTPDVSKDKKWEEFRLCMQQGCSGGDDQPSNVECYKTITFDNQFNSCKPLIEESKRKEFKAYFLNTFIPNEKKEFCENKEGPLQGKYENDTCKITIKFKRNAHKNECLSSCDKIERTKTVSINKPFTCSPEWFGVSPCYKDSNGCSEAKVKKITGGIALAGGVVTGLVSGVTTTMKSSKQSATIEIEGEDGKKEQVTVKNAEELEKYKKQLSGDAYKTASGDLEKSTKKDHAAGALEGISAGLEGVKQGTSDLITASLMEKEKGEALKGNCILPDGSAIGEGMSKKITW